MSILWRSGVLSGVFLSMSLAAGGAQGLSARAYAADLRFRLTADPSTLDWNLARSSLETYVIMNVMEGLVEEGADLNPRPALARKWEISPDGKTYTFTLREGVKWSDGRALSASDFEESWFRLLDPRTRSSYADLLFEVENAEAFHSGKIRNRAAVGIKALGPSKFQVKLRKPVPHFLHLATFWVTFPIRMDLVRKNGRGWASPGKMATLGPYLITSWKKGAFIDFKLNPRYHDPAAVANAPQTVEAVIEADDRKARRHFESGKLDFLLNATTRDLLKAKGQAGEAGPRVEQYPYLSTYYLAFNVQAGPLKNVNIRKAIALAVDRDRIPSVLQGGQIVAKSWFPPGIPGHGEENGVSGSILDAKGALSGAGFVEGQGFPRLPFWVERFDGSDRVARFIADGLRERLGISLDIRFGESKDYLKDPEAALFLTHWGADYPDPENFLAVFSKSRDRNYARWESAEYDRFVEKGRATSDAGERLVAYGAAEKILLRDEVVILPLFYKKNTVLLGERIKDFNISPLNYLFFKSVTLQTPKPR